MEKRKTEWSSPAQFLFVLVALAAVLSTSEGFVRMCYYTNWSQYRPGRGKFLPEKIDPFVCTHILYAFGAANATTDSISTVQANDLDLYNRTMSLKKVNPNLKVILALGGWNAKSTHFTKIASSGDKMKRFNTNALAFLRKYNFDGLDFDWEYPTERDGHPEDRRGFTVWLKSLRQLFDNEAAETKQPRLLITLAVVASISRAKNMYEIAEIAKTVDFINLMTYDYHGNWDAASGAHSHSKLFPDTDRAVTGWIRESGLPSKLALGIPAYGYTQKLKSDTNPPKNYGDGEPTTGPGSKGPYLLQSGTLSYLEICENIKNKGWKSHYLQTSVTTAAWGPSDSGLEWVGYDDVDSVKRKASYIKEKGLAGSMLWSLDFEDYDNVCGKGKYPIANALKETLPNEFDGTVTTPVTTSTSATTINFTTRKSATDSTTTTTTTTAKPTTASTTSNPTTRTTTVTLRRSERNWAGCKIQYMPKRWCNPARAFRRHPRKFALMQIPGLPFCLLCSCYSGYEYNPCTKKCVYPRERRACSL